MYSLFSLSETYTYLYALWGKHVKIHVVGPQGEPPICVELIALTTYCSTALRRSAIIIIIIIIWPREKHIKRITRRKKECTRGEM